MTVTQQDLSDLLFTELICGCGNPEEGCRALLRLLRMHPLHQHQAELMAWLPDTGVRMLLLGQIDHAGLTEHGGTIEGGWLTDRGEAVRDALAEAEADDFEALTK